MVAEERRGQRIEERLEALGRQILCAARNELYVRMRFLDVALSSFHYEMDVSMHPAGTDGLSIFYNPQELGGWYRRDRFRVNRLYLHMLFHCIFRHMVKRNGREEVLWNLACDITIEYLIDGLYIRNVRAGYSALRRDCYRKLKKGMRVVTAEKVYRMLMAEALSECDRDQLCSEFYVDDHQYWKNDADPKKQSEINRRWQDISEQMQTEMETFSKDSTDDTGHLLEQIQVENRERYDYRSFLRKFAVLREEITVDEDSFDYGFYSYGLRLYGNMPLIEPQEWKEVQMVEEFVIVIDTSMSCSGELVRKFLEETYGILTEQESFFKKVNIHILQCDEKVQEDRKITNEKELKVYMEQLELKGGGGTDFRPAFAYIEELLQKQEVSRLRGVLYFTDGHGIYPVKKPPYETAFLFMKEDYTDIDVPAWAMKLILEEEDLTGQEQKEDNETWI
ncbi:MAG TPA: metallopeptidase [Lachnospiraceae bacterium]|nr:metallopeptidase [Lachnospiraceae bacterium]